MTLTTLASATIPPVSRPRRPSVWARIAMIPALIREHQQLSRLNEAHLRDIGVTRAEAEAEANRPIWDIPVHRGH